MNEETKKAIEWLRTVDRDDDDFEDLSVILAHLDALQAFKTFVHARLDRAGVPADPPGEHRDAGCRIGQRLDAVFTERDALRVDVADLRSTCAMLRAQAEAARRVIAEHLSCGLTGCEPCDTVATEVLKAMDEAKP